MRACLFVLASAFLAACGDKEPVDSDDSARDSQPLPDSGDSHGDSAPTDTADSQVGGETGDTRQPSDTGDTGTVAPDLNHSLEDAYAIIRGDRDHGMMGVALASVGDVTGDGNNDLLVGAEYVSYLFAGPISGELDGTNASVVLEDSDNGYGRYVYPAGDMDGDGIAELITTIPSPMTGHGHADTPSLYLLHGPITADMHLEDADAVVYGGFPNSGVANNPAVSDVDGDGRRDLWVRDSTYDDGSGGLFLFRYPMEGVQELDHADAVLTGPADEVSFLGATMSCSGDVDGDGLDDLLAGAPSRTGEDGTAAVVYLVLNTQDGTTSIEDADGSYTEADMDMELGYWVGLVDIDGDGHADLAIGDAADERGGSEAGAILVVPGSSVGHYLVEDAVEWVLAGSVGDGVGLAAGIGDADGDGAEDMLVGVTSSRENLGGFYVVRTPAAGVTTLAVETPWFAGPETWDCVSSWYGCGLAYSAETLGGGHDLTGDGLEDWAVAAPYAEWESSSDGAILIWSGAEL